MCYWEENIYNQIEIPYLLTALFCFQYPLINYLAFYEVEDEDDPTREAIIAMVEKDVAFSDVDNRRLLMGFIKKVCQAEKFL